jgi:outer membrane protein assembly factor BamB
MARAAATLLAALLAAPTALAADAWPVARHDAANTNRSSVVSAQGPALVPGWPIGGLVGPPLVAPDGAVELPAAEAQTAIINRDGTRQRILPVGSLRAIGVDGRLYAWQTPADPVSAHTPAGDLLWRSPRLGVGPEASNGELRPGPDGSVYVSGDWGLSALDSSGRLRWSVPLSMEDNPGALALGPDGTVYFGLLQGTTATLVARRPDGQTLWQRPLAAPANRVAVTGDGTVIVLQGLTSPEGGTALLAVAPDGSERWTLPTGRDTNGMAIGADGTVYLVDARGIQRADGLLVPGVLRAIGPDGSVRWTYRDRVANADPIVGGDGTIYVGGSPLVALHPDGTRAWAFPPASRPIVPTAIGGDGTLFAEGGGGAMLALAGPSAPARVTPPSPARQRVLIAGLRLRPARFRMRGRASLCATPGLGCRPRTPLGATLSFTLKRDCVVSVVVRRAGRRPIVAHRDWRAGAGTTWSGLWDAIDYRTLAPGRYTLTVRAAAGTARVTTRPLGFIVVRT